MKKCLLFLVITFLVILSACTPKQGDTIVNNTYVISEDSLWEPTNGPYGSTIYSLKVDSKDNIFITGRNQFEQTYWIKMSSDNGQTWKTLTDNFTDTISSANVSVNFGLVLKTNNNDVYLSKDNGITWQTIFNKIHGITSYYLNIDYKDNVFAYSHDKNYLIYKSNDFGKSWKSMLILDTNEIFQNIYVDNKNNYYIITYDDNIRPRINKLYLSTDEGTTWNVIYQKSYSSVINNIFYIDANNNLYIKCNTNYFIDRSKDQGKTWQTLSYVGMNSETIRILRLSKKGYLYIVTSNGIKRSIDNGDSWHSLINTYLSVSELAIDSKGYLYAVMSNGVINRTKKPVE